MSVFTDLLTAATLDSVRSTIIAYAQTANLLITDWIVGSVGQQTFEAVASTVYNAGSNIAQVIRGYASLDTSTDPGDVDPYNPVNQTLTPAPGMLSNYGLNTYATERQEATFASGFVTFDNSLGVVPRTFGPDTLTFTYTGGTPPSPAPTYKNSADPTIYTNADGTVTVPAGSTLVIPITADVAGSGSNAPAGVITLSTAMTNVTATNADAVLGRDRQSAASYREACRQAPARTSFGGPAQQYTYLASYNLDGTALDNANGDPVNITRAQVTQDSATGIVNAYFASPTGAAIGADVTAANTNIQIATYGIGDAITYNGAAASEVAITVQGTAKIAAGPGVVSATVRQAIVDALTAAFAEFPIGGVDQVSGAGVIYTNEFHRVAANAYPGLYNVVITVPAGASTALAVGEVATYAGVIGDWTLTIV